MIRLLEFLMHVYPEMCFGRLQFITCLIFVQNVLYIYIRYGTVLIFYTTAFAFVEVHNY